LVSNDREERARVRSRIGKLILIFCRGDRTFHMDELRRFVEEMVESRIAPDSPGRILRQLRQEGMLDYTVVSRTGSLYKVEWVGAKPERPAEQVKLFAARSS